MLRRVENTGGGELFAGDLRGFFTGRRFVFPINDLGGSPVGFAARSLKGEAPKYLFSYDFPRRDTLLGADRVLRALQASKKTDKAFQIYLVEGHFDQLRLESLGFHALALLGAKITAGQIVALRRIIEAAESTGRTLSLQIFLDPDDAGQRGAHDAVLALFRLLDDVAPFDLEVIAPLREDQKMDPDEFLKGKSRQEAEQSLANARVSPLLHLVAYHLSVAPSEVAWDDIVPLQRVSMARRIATALLNSNWARVSATLDLSDPHIARFAALVSTYAQPKAEPNLPHAVDVPQRGDDRADLLTALTMGRSSTMRREYPLDDDAWDRLAVAASPMFHIHKLRLQQGDGPSLPALARHLPKGNGRYRLKAGPAAADAILQQYALVELLRDRPETLTFSSGIPAVRYSEDRLEGHKLYRTGLTGDGKALSFAYQVDMAVVNAQTPPRREGVFRPYFDCWRSFIDFLDNRIRHYRHEELQILRLDVTGFYENVSRDVVGDALQIPLERALHSLGAADGGVGSFAPLLQPEHSQDPAARARTFTDFLLRHSFGLDHLDPESGELAPIVGLPQGPDLSAYLANISLFTLDDLMGAEVERLDYAGKVEGERGERCSAAYARYVDDIVLVCANAEIAAQLRRKVEAHLEAMGLSLNRKNAVPPPMTRAQARDWLTDNRVGFGFSGPLAEMPPTEAMDPLADAGEIDRKTALGLLHDPELDDPLQGNRSIQRLTLALRASEVRFGDRANAYRRLWCIAAERTEDRSGAELAKSFWSLLLKAEPELSSLDERRLDLGLAAVEGLDRALRAAVPYGAFDEENCCRIEATKEKLSEAILDDVFTPFAKLIFNDGGAAFLARYDLRCQIAIIASLAADHSQKGGELRLQCPSSEHLAQMAA